MNLSLKISFLETASSFRMILHLEKYEIKIEDDELIPENLDNLQNVARFVSRKIDAGSAAAS